MGTVEGFQAGEEGDVYLTNSHDSVRSGLEWGDDGKEDAEATAFVQGEQTEVWTRWWGVERGSGGHEICSNGLRHFRFPNFWSYLYYLFSLISFRFIFHSFKNFPVYIFHYFTTLDIKILTHKCLAFFFLFCYMLLKLCFPQAWFWLPLICLDVWYFHYHSIENIL